MKIILPRKARTVSSQATAAEAVRTRERGRDSGAAGFFLGPAAILVLLLSLFPFIFSLATTFTNWNLLYNNFQLQGFSNWNRLLSDDTFRQAARNTVMITVVGTAIEYILGLALALLVLQVGRGQKLFRLVFLLPMMISPAAVGYIVGRMMFDEQQGPINDLLFRLGLPTVPWLSSTAVAPWTIIITDVWQWTSFTFILLLAGLQSLPHEPYEAARVDGASPWQVFTKITFPLLAPVTVTVILIRSLELFKLVDIVRVMTGGGPGNATETATLYVYDTALQYGDMGYGSTIAYALLIMVILYATIYLLVTRRAVERVS